MAFENHSFMGITVVMMGKYPVFSVFQIQDADVIITMYLVVLYTLYKREYLSWFQKKNFRKPDWPHILLLPDSKVNITLLLEYMLLKVKILGEKQLKECWEKARFSRFYDALRGSVLILKTEIFEGTSDFLFSSVKNASSV